MLWQRSDLLQSLQNKISSQEKKTDNHWHQWSLTESLQQRQDFYLLQHPKNKISLDQSRELNNHQFQLRLYVKKSDGQLGVAEGPLFLERDLQNQLNTLEKKAFLGSEKYWQYPIPKKLISSQKPQTIYEPLIENFSQSSWNIYQQLVTAIESSHLSHFNSSELFVISDKKTITLSSGFSEEKRESKIYAEVCYSAKNDASQISEEFLLTKWACHPDQLDFSQMCEDSYQYAQMSLETEKPPSGKYHVLLSADVLNILWHDVLGQMNSRRKYYRQPFIAKDSLLFEKFCGMSFQLQLDPSQDYCLASQSFNEDGLMATPQTLIKNNRLQTHLTSSQMAQYLDGVPTGERGSLVIEPESFKSKEELVHSQERVLEILQFSGLFTNDMDLTFSSEIRLGRIYDKKANKVTFIKGGNLSGHFLTNFSSVQWGGRPVVDNQVTGHTSGITYCGPSLALISEVTITS